MNEILVQDFDDISWRDRLAYLTYRMSFLPQVEMPLEHIFEDGQYIRELRVPRDTLVIGSPHLMGHHCQLVSGEVFHITEQSKSLIRAPYHIKTSPGYQMVVYTLTDIVSRTIHPNPSGSTDVEMLEKEFFEPKESVKERGYYVSERIGYRAMIRHYGVDEAKAKSLYENNSDIIPMLGNFVYIDKSKIDGLGSFASREVGAGEIVVIARIGANRTPAGRYTNHSFYPNSEMVADGDRLVIRALKDIAFGEEITIDYREAIKESTEVTCRQQLLE